MSRSRPPRVVAELGRPETPEETAARKAENSRKYRGAKTVNNLVYSLLVTVVLVGIIVLAVPRSDESLLENVDYGAVAATAQESYPQPLANPDLPGSWTSNRADVSKIDGVQSWNIGLITPSDQFIGITQGIDANETWTAQQLKKSLASSTVTIDGIEWTVYDNGRDTDGRGNVHYALTTVAGESTFLLFGTASESEFRTVAESISDDVTANLNEGNR
ncbi:DUF4245 domain-containing protein [Mycetocola zhadangensis]|uniref:DUF4245 domain-containing protein n=1 Tax=Mycetocola zhadangensis TaxID=1164595 RepID=A0A3L7J5N3_9MICO|nr:DUF4245 domain-containing protein [Mycetocola zhadangensis]RLQ85665.1 DUF4245 domain-containing protein [Mycetocola zhadangensis]GGE84608.1 hypothetical protein GCM10011313_03880 [Mycetocola zhadangensis]